MSPYQAPTSVDVRQAITDFPVPPGVVPGPAWAVTLVEVVVRAAPTLDWRPDRDLAIHASRTLGPGQVMTWQSCAVRTGSIGAALRAAGYSPLPTPLAQGGPISGWVAFFTPREAQQLFLARVVRNTSGDVTWDTISLRRPTAHPVFAKETG